MKFSDLNLIPPLQRAVQDAGYLQPSPIQAATIPLVLAGRDVLGCAQTGTGKTAAFALPILQRLSARTGGSGIRALILTPTRELALQIHESFCLYGKYLGLKCGVIFGGVGQSPQVQMLAQGVDILVATPGRLNDLIGQGHVSLARLQIFVLDEADRMLDMGFIHDVRRVIAQLPARRQTLLFSATMPPEIESLAAGILRQPETVKVDPVTSTVARIDQSLYLIDKANKKLLLAQLLSEPEVKSALVFTRTKHGADRVVRELARAGIEAAAIHGNKSQSARQNALGAFRSGRIRVLVATDIAARGIDVPELSHVINYELPNEPETYIHRIGRTGRAGRGGRAISFCCYDELDYRREIEKLTGRAIPVLESPWPMLVLEKTVKQPPQPRKKAPQEPAPARTRTAEKPSRNPPEPAVRKPERPAAGAAQTAETAAQPSAIAVRRRRRRRRKPSGGERP